MREPDEFSGGFSALALGAVAFGKSVECVLAYPSDEIASAILSAIPDAVIRGDVGAVRAKRVVRTRVVAAACWGEADADAAACVRGVVVAVRAECHGAVLVATAMPKATPARKQNARAALARLELIDNGVS